MSCCPTIVNVPGPRGAAGTNGTNGVDGIDSFTYTTAQFVVPALGAWVLVFVDNSDFLPESVAGQFFVSIQGVGYMQVVSVDGLQLTLQNPAAGILGIPNAVPTTVIPAGSLITLAGAIGPTGAAGAAGGAPVDASYICRTGDGTLNNETALDLLAAGYMKTAGSGGAGVVSTTSTIPVADISGTLPVAKGGTNLTTAPANKIPVGDGTNYLQKEIVGSLPIVVTNSAGNITISAPSIASFNYVTFTRRIASNNPSISSSFVNPFNSTTYPLTTYSGFDTASGFTASNGRFVAPYSGYYSIRALIPSGFGGGVYDLNVQVRKNGVSIYTAGYRVSAVDEPPTFVEYLDQASSGDYYELYLQSLTANSSFSGSLSVQRLQA